MRSSLLSESPGYTIWQIGFKMDMQYVSRNMPEHLDIWEWSTDKMIGFMSE